MQSKLFIKNTRGEGKNADLRAFSPFSSVFSNLSEREIVILAMLNPFPNKPLYLRVCSTSLLKTLPEKEKMLTTSNASFSPSVFYPYEELSVISIIFKIVVCKL